MAFGFKFMKIFKTIAVVLVDLDHFSLHIFNCHSVLQFFNYFTKG